MTTTDQPAPAASSKRTDLWVDAFDGLYRLFLPLPLLCELEGKAGYIDKDGNRRACSIFVLYDRVSKGRYELDGQPVGYPAEGAASANDCLETVRLALVGGGHAIVHGARVKVTAARAMELVKAYLENAPLEESWKLAFLILNAVISGREAKPNEVGKSSRIVVFPDGHDQEDTEAEG